MVSYGSHMVPHDCCSVEMLKREEITLYEYESLILKMNLFNFPVVELKSTFI